MNPVELATQSDSLRSDLDKLDLLIDTMSDSEILSLSKVYESISIILKAQQTLIKNKPGLKIVKPDVINTHLQLVRRAAGWNHYKWPPQLTSGVMFFEGERITIEEFMEQVNLFKGLTD